MEKHETNNFKQVKGTLTAIRLSADKPDSQGAVKIDGRWFYFYAPFFRNNVKKETDEAASKRIIGALQRIAQNGAYVVAGIRVDKYDGRPQLRWLFSSEENALPPSAQEDGWYSLKVFIIWAIISISGLVLSIITLFYSNISFFLFLLGDFLALGGGILAFIYYLEASARLEKTERHADKCRQTIQKELEEKGFASIYGRTVSAMQTPEALDDDKALPEQATDESETPHLYRVVGRVDKIKTVTRTQNSRGVLPAGDVVVPVSSRVSITYFFLLVDGATYVILTHEVNGLFLAKGDEVALVASTPGHDSESNIRPVWALRNLTDGQAYVCHEIMAPSGKKFRKPFMGKARLIFTKRSLLKAFSLVCLFVNSVSFVLFFTLGVEDALGFLALMVMAPWSLTVLPPLLSRLKWRLGHPGRHQRLTTRVYKLLRIGHPLAPKTENLEI